MCLRAGSWDVSAPLDQQPRRVGRGAQTEPATRFESTRFEPDAEQIAEELAGNADVEAARSRVATEFSRRWEQWKAEQ